jgi:hypothetical protein
VIPRPIALAQRQALDADTCTALTVAVELRDQLADVDDGALVLLSNHDLSTVRNFVRIACDALTKAATITRRAV